MVLPHVCFELTGVELLFFCSHEKRGGDAITKSAISKEIGVDINFGYAP
jgi:hypothetical protein